MAEIKLTGLEAFRRDLQRLDFSKRKSVLVAAALRAVEPFRQQAELLAPVDSGRLARNIVAQEDSKNSDMNSVTVVVAATSKAFYGSFQEFGTAHHRPQPFLQPALDATIADVQNRLGEYIDDEIDKALRS